MYLHQLEQSNDHQLNEHLQQDVSGVENKETVELIK